MARRRERISGHGVKGEQRHGGSQVTVHVVGVGHLIQAGLGAMLREQPTMRIIGDTVGAETASFAVSETQPDVIVIEVAEDGNETVSLATELHAASPSSAIVVVGSKPRRDLLLALGRIPIGGFLSWDSLDTEAMRYGILAVVRGGLRIGSPAAVKQLVAEPPPDEVPSFVFLTDHQRTLLDGLLEGLTVKEISRQSGASVSTLNRAMKRVKVKQGASGEFLLGRLTAWYRPDGR